METGNTFANGSTNSTILAVFRSPDMVMGDPGVRKYMQRVNLNYEGEGTTVTADLAVRYDYDDQNTPQPDKISITSGSKLYSPSDFTNEIVLCFIVH